MSGSSFCTSYSKIKLHHKYCKNLYMSFKVDDNQILSSNQVKNSINIKNYTVQILDLCNFWLICLCVHVYFWQATLTYNACHSHHYLLCKNICIQCFPSTVSLGGIAKNEEVVSASEHLSSGESSSWVFLTYVGKLK